MAMPFAIDIRYEMDIILCMDIESSRHFLPAFLRVTYELRVRGG